MLQPLCWGQSPVGTLLGVGQQMAGEQEAPNSFVSRARESVRSPAASQGASQAGKRLCGLFLGFCWIHLWKPQF